MMPVGAHRRQFPKPVADVIATLQQLRAISAEKQRQHVGVLQDQIGAVRLKPRQGALGNLFGPTGDRDFLNWDVGCVESLQATSRHGSEAAYRGKKTIQ